MTKALRLWIILCMKTFLHSLCFYITKFIGGRKICVICNSQVPFWIPHYSIIFQATVFRRLGLIGSDLKKYRCPICGCNDRVRHLALYFKATGFLKEIKGKDVLHFAPEKEIVDLILSFHPHQYVQADLCPIVIGVEQVDIQHLSYKNKSFDFVICNHVLEHVKKDDLALREIYRILKPGGQAVLQTPYSECLKKTIEDQLIKSPGHRRKAYGDSDHLRLYGKDFFEKVCAFGFESNIFHHDSILGDCDVKKYGVNQKEPFMGFKKQRICVF